MKKVEARKTAQLKKILLRRYLLMLLYHPHRHNNKKLAAPKLLEEKTSPKQSTMGDLATKTKRSSCLLQAIVTQSSLLRGTNSSQLRPCWKMLSNQRDAVLIILLMKRRSQGKSPSRRRKNNTKKKKKRKKKRNITTKVAAAMPPKGKKTPSQRLSTVAMAAVMIEELAVKSGAALPPLKMKVLIDGKWPGQRRKNKKKTKRRKR
mmetsp:Transcript_15649/g.27691  ORF Transcript_15649/g.27691 Transcript_15649/m.27691 type:complete len:205 (+) Transcript_15649:585-1199(+)